MSPADLEQRLATVGSYPVAVWNPKECGEMDLTICADGTWKHEGVNIKRQSLISLFSKLLRYEPDGYYLVTPVEKLKITVEDLPFLAIDFDLRDEGIIFTSDQDDRVRLGVEHPLAFDGDDLRPRIKVRHDLWARVTRAAWYRLVEIAHIRDDKFVIGTQAFDLKPSVI